jgi:hypothetical protein
MIIGSGPIVIGQACEFDYSGTQACKALRKLGYKIVLANSNPATIMTDPGMADATYIEPLNVAAMTEIIAKERPDALLPNLGGQTGLNLSAELARRGVLKEYGVKVIGVDVDAIERGEDRLAFKQTMQKLGIEMPRSNIASSFGLAYYKSQEAARQVLPMQGTVLISVTEKDRPAVQTVARRFAELGFKIKATDGTHRFFVERGIPSEPIRKIYEGRPNIVDAIMNKEINLVINTPIGRVSQGDDAYIRQAAIKYNVPYVTTLRAAMAAAEGIAARRAAAETVRSLQEYHREIRGRS